MKRAILLAAILSIPFMLLAVAWQAGRFDSLAAEARRLELSQGSWVEENEKLGADIRVLSSRERAATLAESLGLEKAGPERRVRILLPSTKGSSSD